MVEQDRSFGARLAKLRRLRGLSQAQFAQRVERSVPWLSQVERGARHIDRMSVLEALAAALDVPLAELASDAPVVAAKRAGHSTAVRLRLVLAASYPVLAVISNVPVPALSALEQSVDDVWAAVHLGDLDGLPDQLETLLPELERAARAGEHQRQANELLASAYHAMAAAFSKLREVDAAWIATDRAIHAAERSGDPLLAAAGAFRLAVVFQGAGQYEQVEHNARTVADGLMERFRDLGDPARSVWGALTLQRAVAAARSDNAQVAYQLLDDVREVAARVGSGRNDYHTEFSPVNVQVHEVAIAADLGDAGRALRVAAGIDSEGLSAERRTRLLIDVARAHNQRRDSEQAVRSLVDAEEIAANIVHEHYYARQIITDLLGMSDDPAPTLVALARRCGIVPN
jgi:transcriptional regulator with XRE-family HTH domain